MQEKTEYNLIIPRDNLLQEARFEEYRAMDGSMQKELVVTLRLAAPAAEHVFLHKDSFFLTANRGQDAAKLHVLIYSGELKYFYENYKDYYYLPMEDVAMHKSVAAYVDKQHRKQATATTAYLRRTGTFLPQPAELYKPAFKKEYWGKVSYFELPKRFCDSHEEMDAYICYILKYLGISITGHSS